MKSWLIAAAAVLLLALGGALLGNHYQAVKQERNKLRTELTQSTAEVGRLKGINDTNVAVLEGFAKETATIKKNATNVQREIQKRLAGLPVCVLPPDWGVLHDAAASNSEVPEATGVADETGPTAEDAASVVAENYEQYHEVANQLHALQRWIQGVSNAPESERP